MFRALARLLPYLLRVRQPIVAGLASILAATVISLISPWILKLVVDDLTSAERVIERGRLAWYAGALLGLALADGGFRYLMRTLLIGASRQIEYDLRNDFFAHLERLPLGYYQARRTGDLMSRATNDLGAVRMMVGPAVMYFASTALGFIIAVGLMAWIDLRLTLVALLPLPAVSVATHYFGKAIHDRFERIQDRLADMSAVVQEALSGVRVVRAYRQESAELDRFRASNDEYVERNQRLIRLQAAFYPSLTFCFGISGLLVIWIGGRDVIAGRLTLGEFVAFSRYLVLLAWPLIAFGWVINIVQRGIASLERMGEVLDAPTVQTPASLPLALVGRSLTGQVSVRGLTFQYPGTTSPVLEDISFEVSPGRTVALVGPTGSGKSTVVSLLARLHEPPRGTMFVDGIDILDLPIEVLRGAMGVVPQEPFLFSDTIADNIAFGETPPGAKSEMTPGVISPGSPDITSGVVSELTPGVISGLDQDVADFPAGYGTLVGERGITLSGGQKQRVAIARAVARDPRLLILDDALSAVDTGTEERILQHLRRVRQSRATIVVAHRVSTVRDADEILVILGGRVVERGSHDALVARGGEYARMHERQLLEQEIETT